MSLEERVRKLEQRLEREMGHFNTVLATQRETITRALQDVQVTLIEQEVTVRSQMLGFQTIVHEVLELVLEQEAWRKEVESRLDGLEGKPPAA